MRFSVVLLSLLGACLTSVQAFAIHPLITDDTGTQGKGKFQLEVNGEFANENEDGAKANTTKISTTLSYGIVDDIDFMLGVPYQFIRIKAEGATTAENGISDISLELKWRFFEKGGLSLALKPGMSFPAGDEKRGLGSGKTAYSIFFITTKEIEPWAFHLNLGYIRNENNANERENLWHASVAAQVEALKNLNLVANVGLERNTDRLVDTPPAFVLGGLIYSVSETFDIDFGIKGGLNKPETDYSVLAGITCRF